MKSKKYETDTSFFANEKISKILLKTAPPIMFAQLIQALYNIIDSLFVGKYAETGLTALSIVYPLQLLMIAFGTGAGVGINTIMAARYGTGDEEQAKEYAGIATILGTAIWIIFALVSFVIMPFYAKISSSSEIIIQEVVSYGRIVCVFSMGLLLESVWSKVIQAHGDMKTPMIAQVTGAIINIILDPILIFGVPGLPGMGIIGAAIATVIGQMVAAVIVFRKGFYKPPFASKILRYSKNALIIGFPNILMQSAYTFYILGLNLILSGFSDQAVTALGLYYKWQTFFFIPLGSMQTCIIPILSFNYAAGDWKRCRQTLISACAFGCILMGAGACCFEFIPVQMLKVFTKDPMVIEIGKWGYRFVGASFIPMVISLIIPVFFQALGYGGRSSFLTILRTVCLFVPLGYVFSRFGLKTFWLTFPVTEIVTTSVGVFMYRRFASQQGCHIED